jgi:tRNA threonylcarbamoyladenosine modification (KEOPS) complex  Pcc1 subunit
MAKNTSTGRGGGAQAEIIIRKRSGIDYKKVLSSQDEGPRGRSTTTITETADTVRITISAEDQIALRAAMNSIMREMQVLDSVGSLNLENRRTSKQGK